MLLFTLKGERRVMKIVEVGIIVLQERSPLLLLVRSQRRLYQIGDGVLRRYNHLYRSHALLDAHVHQHLRWPEKRLAVIQRNLQRQCEPANAAPMFLRPQRTRRVLTGEFSPMTRWHWSHAYEDKYFGFPSFLLDNFVYGSHHMR